jgi:hypothetical protein
MKTPIVNHHRNFIFWFVVFCAVEAFLLVYCVVGHAAEIPEPRAVNALIGEAEGEGYRGMLAIGCAIRNRGTLQGVYGEHAPRVVHHKYNLKTYALAVQAWRDSAKEDITDGADHWGGKTVDSEWIAKMKRMGYKKTFEYRNQEFYRGT